MALRCRERAPSTMALILPVCFWRPGKETTDDRNRRLLHARRERPCRCPAEKRDKLPALQDRLPSLRTELIPLAPEHPEPPQSAPKSISIFLPLLSRHDPTSVLSQHG